MQTLCIACGFSLMLLGPCMLAAVNFRHPEARRTAGFANRTSEIPDVT